MRFKTFLFNFLNFTENDVTDSEEDELNSSDIDTMETSQESRLEDGSNSNQSESDPECDETTLPGQGLANVMAKILNKKVQSNNVILAKGNTDKEILERKRKREKAEKAKGGIEVVGETTEDGPEGESGSDSDVDPGVLREKRLKVGYTVPFIGFVRNIFSDLKVES